MELVVHIGAHRTGSTMVSQSIEATIAAHPDCGVTLWGARHLRDIAGFQATPHRLDDDIEPIDKASAIALDGIASVLARDVAAERARGTKTLIMSEENIVGGMRNNFRARGFYVDAARRMAAYDSLFPLCPSRIAMGVRNYGAVWTSAYHYQPQTGRPVPALEPARQTMLNDRRGWPGVAKAVRSVWTDASLLMWQQEHLHAHAADICAAIMGIDKAMVVLPKGKVNARKPKTPRPEVFSDEERKHLTHRYNRHLRRMRNDGVATWVGADVAA